MFARISLIALIAATISTQALADPKGKTPYDVAAECLCAITVTYEGKSYSMKPDTHFKKYGGSGSPDDVVASGISLKAGLLEHPSWAPKKAEIEACLKKIPNLGFVGRTN